MIKDGNLAPEPLLRNMIADYLNCTSDGESDDWQLMGTGFSSLNENPNAQEQQTTYINQKTSSTYVKGYQTEFSYNCDLIKSEKAVMALYAVGRDHLTGTGAMFEYVRVDLYDPVGSGGTSYKARKFIVSAVPSSTEGDGGNYITGSGTLKAVGDPVQGTFDTKALTFAATTN